jgi:hypothetical protein
MSSEESNRSYQEAMEDAVVTAANKALDEKVLLAGWVLVAEILDPETGDSSLLTLMDSHTPPWDGYGMLQWASDELTSLSHDVDD